MKTSIFLFLFIAAIAEFVTAKPQNVQYQQPGQVVALPFYGGAKGQVLQITKDESGAVLNQMIVPDSANTIQQGDQSIDDDNQRKLINSQKFTSSLYNIQASAQKLVELQEKTKKSGQFKADDQKLYASNLAVLGESASNLAKLGNVGDRDFSELFLSNNGIKRVDTEQNNDSIREEDEEDVGEEHESEGGDSNSEDQDSVQINGPNESASVAEAKPVGVAIAGEGGVASSKPVATAVVGPGGLAIARPVATAISGVDPGSVGFSNKIPLSLRKAAPERVQAAQRRQAIYMNNLQNYASQEAQMLYPIDLAIF